MQLKIKVFHNQEHKCYYKHLHFKAVSFQNPISSNLLVLLFTTIVVNHKSIIKLNVLKQLITLNTKIA